MVLAVKRTQKKCRECKELFWPESSWQVICSFKCGIKQLKKTKDKRLVKKKKAFNAETRRRKDAIKTKSQWLNELQTVINKYVRIRDKGKPCISCDKPDNGQHQRHASHFKSVGSNTALRFNLWNIHAGCSKCNNHLSGNIGEYMPKLINKIGQEKYDWLLTQNQVVRYEIDYIKRFKRVFSKKIRMIERRVR